MPYVEVWVDAPDDLDDFSDADLQEELESRARRKTGNPSLNVADFRIPKGAARDALNQAADELRKVGKNAVAFKLEEIREDFVGH